MRQQNPKFKREPASQRKDALIRATLSLIAERGVGAATVRAIAEHAQVSQGLIRHYFATKEDLIIAAYERHMSEMTAATDAPLLSAAGSAHLRLAMFVAASLRPPVVDPRSVALWAAFLSRVRLDDGMRGTHERTYFEFRDRLQALISAALSEAGRPAVSLQLQRLAIACNAVIDGLWLEGGALPDAFDADELVQIGLQSVGAILDLELSDFEDKA